MKKSFSQAFAHKKKFALGGKEDAKPDNTAALKPGVVTDYGDVDLKESKNGGRPQDVDKDSKVPYSKYNPFQSVMMAGGGKVTKEDTDRVNKAFPEDNEMIDRVMKAKAGTIQGDAKERMALNEAQYPNTNEMHDEEFNRNLLEDAPAYSKGGKVANADHGDADEKSAQYDDLVLRDDLESNNSGPAAGDSLGNAGEDARRMDMIDLILSSRKKKDHNPRPA